MINWNVIKKFSFLINLKQGKWIAAIMLMSMIYFLVLIVSSMRENFLCLVEFLACNYSCGSRRFKNIIFRREKTACEIVPIDSNCLENFISLLRWTDLKRFYLASVIPECLCRDGRYKSANPYHVFPVIYRSGYYKLYFYEVVPYFRFNIQGNIFW